MKRVILFDFDGTITSKDTIKILLIELLVLRPWYVFLTLWLIFRMRCSKKNLVKQGFKNKAVGCLISGLSESDMSEALSRFDSKVKAILRTSMIEKIIDADDKDTLILIVTASPSFAIKYCVSDLPVTVIGTEFIKTDYVFSGSIDGQSCFGLEKVNRINLGIKNNAIKCHVGEAWSDDFSDFPMLKMAEKRFWIGGQEFKKIIKQKDPSGNFVDCSNG